MSNWDDEIVDTAARLSVLRTELGSDYWGNGEVQVLQAKLKRLIGQYSAWAEDKLPAHQRSRLAARYESDYAHLIWPGRSSD